MGTASARCVALTGIAGQVVEVAAEVSEGPPGLTLASMAEPGMWETRDRIRAAVLSSGESWPDQRLTITVPAMPGGGPHYDLAIAVAVLAAAGTVPSPPPEAVLLGELGLHGQLRPVRGVLPAVRVAAAAGCGEAIVPQGNAAEAALAAGTQVTGAASLAAVLAHLRGTTSAPGLPPGGERAASPAAGQHHPPADLADVLGQQTAQHATEVSAAGGHHLLLTGPRGSGTTLLAERIARLLPPLEPEAALEVTALHSLAGLLASGDPLIRRAPFIGPHHTISRAAMAGSGQHPARPGAAALAHRGILFLDQAPEFDQDVLDMLHQPLACGEIVLARAGELIHWPAAFTLVMTAWPCPCGDPGQGCGCTPLARRRYLGRLAGLLPGGTDLAAAMTPPVRVRRAGRPSAGKRSSAVAQRVAAARERAAQRLAGTPWHLNAQVPGPELRRRFLLTPGTLAPLERAVDLGEVSAFGAGRALAVAWTLADLAGLDRPGPEETAAALTLRRGTST